MAADEDGAGHPLSPEQLQAFSAAHQRRRRIDRAAAVATFNGWSSGVFAVLTLPFALFSVVALFLATGLGIIAYHEFKGRRGLRQLNPRSPRLLGMNQIAFAAILIVYSLWCIFAALTGPSLYAEQIAAGPEMARVLGPIEDLSFTITLAVYGSIIVGSVLFQGLNAMYYFTRSRHLQAYLTETPQWVIDLQRRDATT